ncbi:MAG: hypothetical protein J1E64_12605 [Acetatifactor sp.]|nr:hypothetical protein [Acetatifactor sp.]
MKCFRKLLKGLTGSVVTIAILLLIVMGIGFFMGLSSLDRFVITIIIYVVFIVMVLLGTGIYMIVVMGAYRNAQVSLRAIPGFSEARFEREVARSPQVYRLLLSSDAICYTDSGYLVKVIPMADILWAYQDSTVNRMLIYTKDKDKHTVNVLAEGKMRERAQRSEMSIRYILRLIARKNKNAIIGYDANLEQLYKKDFAQLLRRASGREIIDSAQLEMEYIQNNYYQLDFQ